MAQSRAPRFKRVRACTHRRTCVLSTHVDFSLCRCQVKSSLGHWLRACVRQVFVRQDTAHFQSSFLYSLQPQEAYIDVSCFARSLPRRKTSCCAAVVTHVDFALHSVVRIVQHRLYPERMSRTSEQCAVFGCATAQGYSVLHRATMPQQV